MKQQIPYARKSAFLQRTRKKSRMILSPFNNVLLIGLLLLRLVFILWKYTIVKSECLKLIANPGDKAQTRPVHFVNMDEVENFQAMSNQADLEFKYSKKHLMYSTGYCHQPLNVIRFQNPIQ